MSNGSPGPEPPPKGTINYKKLEVELENIGHGQSIISDAVAAIEKLVEEAKKE